MKFVSTLALTASLATIAQAGFLDEKLQIFSHKPSLTASYSDQKSYMHDAQLM